MDKTDEYNKLCEMKGASSIMLLEKLNKIHPTIVEPMKYDYKYIPEFAVFNTNDFVDGYV